MAIRNTHFSVYSALCFGGASVPVWLFLFVLKFIEPLRIIGFISSVILIGISGSIAATALIYPGNCHRSSLVAGLGFGAGFTVGGLFIALSFVILSFYLSAEGALNAFFPFFFPFIIGFTIAGGASAGLTRSRFISVTNGAISFLIGSSVGGIVTIGICHWQGNKHNLGMSIGLITAYLLGGALFGAVSEMSSVLSHSD